ncbi:MAG TPA: winged helix-turn-helix domain-containing protein [Chloroflexota bacterium]|nr:winged helix-turn-helix domain-containing protein [Chloroflexota bacterium]HUM69293.1 winged helix-turn-helix domain-containing protein [Chloroflexota bacterium]
MSNNKITAVRGSDKTMLKPLVYRLRSKLENGETNTAHIETIPGVGYSLRQL